MKRTIPDGAAVKFTHGRHVEGTVGPWYRGKEGWPAELQPRGGHTIAKVVLADGSEIVGEAHCSARDNYSKKIGRDIALGRALAALERRTA